MFPNGIHPEERKLMALGFAVECTSDKQDHELTRKAAESFDQFLSGEQRTASVVSIKGAERLK